MKKNILSICLLAVCFWATSAQAQKDRNSGIILSAVNGLEYKVKAGFNIGGTAPVPLPVEIRSLSGYSPTVATSIEGNVTKWFGEKKRWGTSLGLRLENKGMQTDARVKNYGMEIVGEGGEIIQGYWTGNVKTKVRSSLLAIPLLATYKVSPRFNLNLGPYFSYLIEGDFSGDVYDGYLRENDPTGNKVIFTDGKSAGYDFSKDLRRFQWGAQLGGEWKAFKHLNIYADLTWGLNNIFRSDFETISFAMYPIYLNLGFGYAF